MPLSMLLEQLFVPLPPFLGAIRSSSLRICRRRRGTGFGVAGVSGGVGIASGCIAFLLGGEGRVESVAARAEVAAAVGDEGPGAVVRALAAPPRGNPLFELPDLQAPARRRLRRRGYLGRSRGLVRLHGDPPR